MIRVVINASLPVKQGMIEMNMPPTASEEEIRQRVGEEVLQWLEQTVVLDCMVTREEDRPLSRMRVTVKTEG